MKLLKQLIVGITLAVFAVGAFVMPVSAVNYSVQGGANTARGADQPSDLFGNNGIFQQITNMLLFAIGVLSVIMLIVGGLRYVISGGNKDAVNSAKNTILYAIVGLIVALLAFAVVNFVIGIFTGNGMNMGGSGTNV